MLVPLGGRRPRVEGDVFIADGARVVGDVSLAGGVSVWFGAVLRGDIEPIRIGPDTNLQEHVVVHTEAGHPTTVGAGVTVGHRAVLHGCAVEDGALIGMGAIVLDGAVVEAEAMVGAGALVSQGRRIPARHLAVGVPARVVRPLTPEEVAGLKESACGYRARWETLYRGVPGADAGAAPRGGTARGRGDAARGRGGAGSGGPARGSPP